MDDLDEEARRAQRAPAFGPLLAAGLVSYGGVHLVIAWLFAQVAWSLGAADGDRPIAAMSRAGIGQVALWFAAAGMAVLVVWRVLQVVSHSGQRQGWPRLINAATRLFEAAIYVLIAISAVQAALTRGREGSVQARARRKNRSAPP